MGELRYDIRIAAPERVLVDIRDFAIEENRVTFLFGESGIGKSLIAKALYGLLDPEELRVAVNGLAYERYAALPETRRLREHGFFVFQEPSSHLNPLLTLGEQIREGDLSEVSTAKDILRDLWDGREPRNLLPVYPKPHRPSGGEKQRMLLAMALAKMDLRLRPADPRESPLFIFDEPTGSLDNRSRDTVLRLLMERYQKRRCTILLITHDYSMISFMRKNFPALDLVFREVATGDRRLTVREFVPETYLGWIRERRPAQRPPPRKPLLSIESGLKVFGSCLTISRDENGMEECPLEVSRGSMSYLKAPSGTGKTTVVKILMGLVRPTRMSARLGTITLSENTPRAFWQRNVWGKAMTMAFQHADEALNLQSTVLETFASLPTFRARTPETIREALGQLFDEGLSRGFLQRTVRTLSGGQKQKLNLLRCLVLETDILIFDEPLNGLDFSSAVKVISILEGLQRAGRGILLISHNEEMFDGAVDPRQSYYLHARLCP